MSWRKNRLIGGTAVALICIGLAGCAVVTDLFDPELALALGVDPATVFPQQGTVLISFVNGTRLPVSFYAFESRKASDLSADSRNFSVQVEAGQVRNEVLDCPVEVLGPGRLSQDFAYESLAATVLGDGGGDVNYTGQPLLAGDQYQCGDVIEFRLAQGGTSEEQQYFLTVRIIPGR